MHLSIVRLEILLSTDCSSVKKELEWLNLASAFCLRFKREQNPFQPGGGYGSNWSVTNQQRF